jgi:hypothetical protein
MILLAHNTLEEKEYERLLRKQRAAHDLLSDPKTSEGMTRQTMLSDLLTTWSVADIATQ